MLDLLKSHRIFAISTYKNLLLITFWTASSSLSAMEYHDGLGSLPRVCEHEWVDRYFGALDEDTPVDEVIDFLVGLKAYLQAQGYEVPPLTEMCLRLRDELVEKGIPVDDEAIERIYYEIAKRESIFLKTSPACLAVNTHPHGMAQQIKKRDKKKDIEFSDGFAIGFVKALSGALLCIIPHPVTISIGSGLVVSGIGDMLKHAGDPPNGGSIEDQMRNYPKPPDPDIRE